MADNAKIQHWDDMYAMPLAKIPWEIKDPPKELVEFIQSGQVKGGRALDIGCGSGNYSFWMAQNGFNEVVGVDFSKRALDIGRKNNETLKLPVRFVFADVTKIEEALSGQLFDFILDYSILHHLEPSVVPDYAQQCIKLLKPGGKLLLVCYSDKDEFSSGNNAATGKYGNKMYYRTAEEIRRLYRDLQEVSYKEARLGKRLHHMAHSFLSEKV